MDVAGRCERPHEHRFLINFPPTTHLTLLLYLDI